MSAKLDELCYERAIGYTVEGQLLRPHHDGIRDGFQSDGCHRGFPVNLRTVVQHLLISHHGQTVWFAEAADVYREALAFHYSTISIPNSPPPAARSRSIRRTRMVAYSGALGRQIPPPWTNS